MIEKYDGSLLLWFFQNLSKYKEICHFVSTRIGGFSAPPYDSLNLGFHVGDKPDIVLANRKRLAKSLNIPLHNFTTARQIHDSNVKIVTEDFVGNGAFDYDTAINATDAMVTNIPDVCLMVLQADCVPLLFFDVKEKVIGVAHAGWKGTIKTVAQNTVVVMEKEFNCLPENILVGIGPSIGPCCCEVGAEVVARIDKSFHNKGGYIREASDGKCYFDLWEANKLQLLQMGIPAENVEVAEICTCCNYTTFFSYRYHRKETGRFGAGIMLK